MNNITYYGNTDVGKVRDNNEDTFYVDTLDDGRVLAMAIDGVGGYEGGEVAAEIAREAIKRYFTDFADAPGERILDAMISANNEICDRRQADLRYKNMACVATAAIIDLSPESMCIDMAHVGDTRLYQYYQQTIQKLSHDHSMVGYREEQGLLTEWEAMHHPYRNVITKGLGNERLSADNRIVSKVPGPNIDYVEYAKMPAIPGSTLLFCSDGLCDMITSADMIEVLKTDLSVAEKTDRLIASALSAGGRDNVTVVLVQIPAPEQVTTIIHDEPREDEKDSESQESLLIDPEEENEEIVIARDESDDTEALNNAGESASQDSDSLAEVETITADNESSIWSVLLVILPVVLLVVAVIALIIRKLVLAAGYTKFLGILLQ